MPYPFRVGNLCLVLVFPLDVLIAVSDGSFWFDVTGHEKEGPLGNDRASQDHDEAEDVSDDFEDFDEEADVPEVRRLRSGLLLRREDPEHVPTLCVEVAPGAGIERKTGGHNFDHIFCSQSYMEFGSIKLMMEIGEL